jgi:hypothetical protein
VYTSLVLLLNSLKISKGLKYHSDIPIYQVVNRPFEQVELLTWDKVILDCQQTYRDFLLFRGQAKIREVDHSCDQPAIDHVLPLCQIAQYFVQLSISKD